LVNDDALIINEGNDIVNKCNEYYVNIGYKLANEIVEQQTGDRVD